MEHNSGETREQLARKVAELNQRIAELEASEAKYKRAAKALRESEEDYWDLLENANDMIQNVAPDGGFIYVNRAWREALGYRAEEVTHLSLFHVIHPDCRERCKQVFHRVLSGDRIGRIETTLVAKDGREIVVEGSANCRFVGGKPVAVREVLRDITRRKLDEEELERYRNYLEDLVNERTSQLMQANKELEREVIERKRMEQALQESEERYRRIAENPVVGVAMIQDDYIVYVNDTYCRMFGYERKELVGQALEDKLSTMVATEDCPMIRKRIKRRLSNKEVPKSCVFRGVKTDGVEFLAEVSSSEPFIYKGEPTIVGILRDVTEERKMKEHLLKIQRLESIGTLAGGIAHDFNNILTAILGNISLAKMYKDPDIISERLEEAEKVCTQAQNLTKQLLIFSRGGVPARKTASIAKLLRDSFTLGLRGSNVRYEFAIPDDLWLVEIDEGQMSRAINNLIDNARQAMPEGGMIKVKAENVVVAAEEPLPVKNGEYVRIYIQDQGLGIPKRHLQRIFDPYFTTKQGGKGLGLTTSYFIIENHGGHIFAESQPGAGTVFHIYLPAWPEKVLIEEEPVGEQGAPEKAVEHGGRILVMDDEDFIRELLTESLTSFGYEVVAAADGAEAIELYQNARESGQPFDAVILDLTIAGGMGGKETIQKLIKIDPGVKAIVSSGYSDDPIMSDFKRYGFKGVIAKPYEVGELGKVLWAVLRDSNNG